MRNINRHKSSDKQSIMTESSFALTILLIVGITVTVGTMVLTVFFNLSLPINCRVCHTHSRQYYFDDFYNFNSGKRTQKYGRFLLWQSI